MSGFSDMGNHANTLAIQWSMRNPSNKLAFVLTAILTLPLAIQLRAQQTPTPASPASPETPATQPVPDRPLHIGGSVRPPVVIFSVPPQFTDAARKRKMSGNVQVYCWVDENGNPSHVRAVRGLGMGLDEKAVEAVQQYKFKPAMQNGKPVKVDLYIDVNFQIF
jgi:TonB family protein